MTGLRTVAVVSALGLCLVAGCGTSTGTSAGAPPAQHSATASTSDTIDITNFMFGPMNLTVAAGAKVTVRNDDVATHTLTASDKKFDTGDIKPHGTATFTAPTTPGSYPYICDIHQFMQGTLTVK